MLILTRCPGERLEIGDEVTISIEEIHGLQVRLGITAPTRIPVHRLEVFERIQAEMNVPAAVQPKLQASIIPVRHRGCLRNQSARFPLNPQ